MSKSETIFQPGPAFHDAAMAGMRVMGTSLAAFCAQHGVIDQKVRYYTTGYSNGPKAKKLRAEMIKAIGEDLFRSLYERRLAEGDAA